MGGTQALNIVFADAKRFSSVGVFSSGILFGSVADWEKNHLAVLDDALAKKELKAIWFSTGSDDPFIANTKRTVEILTKHGFSAVFRESAGGHSWVNWRNYLHEFAAQLFR
jgi:enterochelin esterase family protein